MTLLRSLLFIFFSFVEVHVHAKDYVTLPMATQVVMEPDNCLINSSVCSVKTSYKQKFKMIFGTSEVTLDENTILARESADTIILIEGAVLVSGKGVAKVKTEYGVVKGENCDFIVSREGEKIIARSLQKSIWLLPKGSSEELELEPGFKNFLSGVSKKGEAQSGVPLVWDFEKVLNMRARLFAGNKQTFRPVAQDLYKVWSHAVQAASQRHQLYAERYIATTQEIQKIERAKQQKIREEEKELRKMLKERNYLDLF